MYDRVPRNRSKEFIFVIHKVSLPPSRECSLCVYPQIGSRGTLYSSDRIGGIWLYIWSSPNNPFYSLSLSWGFPLDCMTFIPTLITFEPIVWFCRNLYQNGTFWAQLSDENGEEDIGPFFKNWKWMKTASIFKLEISESLTWY